MKKAREFNSFAFFSFEDTSKDHVQRYRWFDHRVSSSFPLGISINSSAFSSLETVQDFVQKVRGRGSMMQKSTSQCHFSAATETQFLILLLCFCTLPQERMYRLWPRRPSQRPLTTIWRSRDGPWVTLKGRVRNGIFTGMFFVLDSSWRICIMRVKRA